MFASPAQFSFLNAGPFPPTDGWMLASLPGRITNQNPEASITSPWLFIKLAYSDFTCPFLLSQCDTW